MFTLAQKLKLFLALLVFISSGVFYLEWYSFLDKKNCIHVQWLISRAFIIQNHNQWESYVTFCQALKVLYEKMPRGVIKRNEQKFLVVHSPKNTFLKCPIKTPPTKWKLQLFYLSAMKAPTKDYIFANLQTPQSLAWCSFMMLFT